MKFRLLNLVSFLKDHWCYQVCILQIYYLSKHLSCYYLKMCWIQQRYLYSHIRYQEFLLWKICLHQKLSNSICLYLRNPPFLLNRQYFQDRSWTLRLLALQQFWVNDWILEIRILLFLVSLLHFGYLQDIIRFRCFEITFLFYIALL